MSSKKEVATELKKGKGLRITAHVTIYEASIKTDTDTIVMNIGENSGQTLRVQVPKGYGLDLMGKDLDLIIVERK